MQCVAVSPWGAPCVAERGHGGDHVPGPVPPAAPIVPQSAGIAAYRAAGRDAVRTAAPRASVPIVLVPTKAQRAAGVRLVDATQEQMPAAARRLRQQAIEAGWAVRVTYAHALMPPKRGGEDWWDMYSVAVRLEHADGRRAWGCWANGKWDSGQAIEPGGVVSVGARELTAYVQRAPAPPVLDASLDSQARQLVGSAA